MKAGLIRLVVAGMLVVGMSAMAADKHHQHVDLLKGVVSAPATNAVAGVVAVLTTQGDAVKTYSLTASDAGVATKIKDAVAKGAVVSVSGELSKDETTVEVKKCTSPDAKKADKPAAK